MPRPEGGFCPLVFENAALFVQGADAVDFQAARSSSNGLLNDRLDSSKERLFRTKADFLQYQFVARDVPAIPAMATLLASANQHDAVALKL